MGKVFSVPFLRFKVFKKNPSQGLDPDIYVHMDITTQTYDVSRIRWEIATEFSPIKQGVFLDGTTRIKINSRPFETKKIVSTVSDRDLAFNSMAHDSES